MLAVVCTAASGQKLTVASFNIRYQNSGDAEAGNGWAQRCPVICKLIQFNDFEIFGAQEVLDPQLHDMLALLPEYAYIGVGREDGLTKGEYSPIFYKTSRFEVLDGGTFWLSEDTSRPNVGWDAALSRICTWGRFLDKEGGLSFWFFNLHLDHVGVEARSNSVKLVLSKISEICAGEPVILTGDFNVDQTNKSYDVLQNSGILRDSYTEAAVLYALNGTFNAFDPNKMTESRIDHIFVSSDFAVERYGVLTDTYRSPVAESDKEIKSGNFPKEVSLYKYEARLPSDHFPVKVVLRYGDDKVQ